MRILIDDGMQVAVGTGIGRYTAHLTEALRNAGAEVTLRSEKPRGNRITRRFRYLHTINSRAYRAECRGYDVVHFTNYAVPRRRAAGVRYAVTVHDLAALLHPETLPRWYRFYGRAALRHAMKRADLVFTVSEAVKAEIEAAFPRYAEKVRVVHPGVYPELTAPAPDGAFEHPALAALTENRFFLCVGTVEKRKNLGIVIEAFRALRKEGVAEGWHLVLAGREGYGAEELRALADGDPAVLFTGYLSEADCRRLYERAAAYVFPSVYEGFGSTQLECMARALPLLESDIPTNREVGGGYGVFFDLSDPRTLTDAMRRVLAGEIDRDALRAVADERLPSYDWDALAPAYLKTYGEE